MLVTLVVVLVTLFVQGLGLEPLVRLVHQRLQLELDRAQPREG